MLPFQGLHDLNLAVLTRGGSSRGKRHLFVKQTRNQLRAFRKPSKILDYVCAAANVAATTGF